MNPRDTARTIRENEARDARLFRREERRARARDEWDSHFEDLSSDTSEPIEVNPVISSDSSVVCLGSSGGPVTPRTPFQISSDAHSSDTCAISTYLRTHTPIDCESAAYYFRVAPARPYVIGTALSSDLSEGSTSDSHSLLASPPPSPRSQGWCDTSDTE